MLNAARGAEQTRHKIAAFVDKVCAGSRVAAIIIEIIPKPRKCEIPELLRELKRVCPLRVLPRSRYVSPLHQCLADERVPILNIDVTRVASSLHSILPVAIALHVLQKSMCNFT